MSHFSAFSVLHVHQTPENQRERVIPWFKIKGDKTLRLNYELDENSLVFDLGGYEGQWSSDIFAMYGCTIHIFEPVEEFANQIERRFSRNNKIFVHKYGLGDSTRTVKVAVNGDESSIHRKGYDLRKAFLLRAIDFIQAHNFEQIDLMKINIEGGEYDLLEHLLDCGFIKHINNIQVQFHDFIPDAEKRMLNIQKQLGVSHCLTYKYTFVWENWRIKRPN